MGIQFTDRLGQDRNCDNTFSWHTTLAHIIEEHSVSDQYVQCSYGEQDALEEWFFINEMQRSIHRLCVVWNRVLTSAAINANVFIPPKNPTQMQIMNMKPDIVRIDDSNPTSLTCDHPGVVGENDSYKDKEHILCSHVAFFKAVGCA